MAALGAGLPTPPLCDRRSPCLAECVDPETCGRIVGEVGRPAPSARMALQGAVGYNPGDEVPILNPHAHFGHGVCRVRVRGLFGLGFACGPAWRRSTRY